MTLTFNDNSITVSEKQFSIQQSCKEKIEPGHDLGALIILEIQYLYKYFFEKKMQTLTPQSCGEKDHFEKQNLHVFHFRAYLR